MKGKARWVGVVASGKGKGRAECPVIYTLFAQVASWS